MTFDETVEVLRGWVGQRVVLVLWSPGSDEFVPRPSPGTLKHRDMWPELADEDNPQRRGEAEFFDVIRSERAPHLSGPEATTLALYRNTTTDCGWVPDEDGRALMLRMHGLAVGVWLAD